MSDVVYMSPLVVASEVRIVDRRSSRKARRRSSRRIRVSGDRYLKKAIRTRKRLSSPEDSGPDSSSSSRNSASPVSVMR